MRFMSATRRNPEDRRQKTEDSQLARPKGAEAFCPLSSAFSPQESGFAIVTAVFLIVVLAALAVFLASIASIQHATSGLDVAGSRAYSAARSGLEWAAYQALKNGSCASGPGPALSGDLAPFSLTINCSATSHDELGTTVTIYQITSTAALGAPGAGDRVERQLQMILGRP